MNWGGRASNPHVDDTEGTPHEDTWYGRGSHGWFIAPLHKWAHDRARPGQQRRRPLAFAVGVVKKFGGALSALLAFYG